MKSLFLLLSCLALSASAAPSTWTVESPGKVHELTVALEGGRLTYRLDRVAGGQRVPVLDASPLGLQTNVGDVRSGLEVASVEKPAKADSAYELPTGKQRKLRDRHTAWSIAVREKAGLTLHVDFRVYDEGLAFRYRFPRISQPEPVVRAEATGFRLPSEGRAWIQPYQKIEQWAPAYEDYFTNGTPLGKDAPGSEGWAFPALFETKGGWVLLTESDLDGGYFGAHLDTHVKDRTYLIRLPLAGEAAAMGWSAEPTLRAPWQGPWRVVVAGATLATIAESSLVHHVSRPPARRDWSWVKPGRSTWSWWSDHASPRDFRKLTPFIDLAQEWGWEYSLIDANWNRMENGDIQQLLAYAKQRKVGLLLWYNSGGKHNEVPEEPRDRLVDRTARRAEFAQLRDWGVKGVKVDFFHSDKAPLIQHYLGILEDAAEFGLMVDFHGCTIPRGWQRTYPNLVTMEAVRGAEIYSCCEDYGPAAVWQNTILPFTRNVIGSMDYTPVTFTNQKIPHQTSFAHELALSVVFESGIQHFADAVEGYRSLPPYAQAWLKEIPVAWDETRYVDGYPGELAVLARRHGKTWYIGGIDGAKLERTLALALPFLTRKRYQVELITDGTDARSFARTEFTLARGEPLKVTFRPAGGFVAKITQK